MEQQRVRKTFKYRLLPTPEQEQALQTVLWRCRELYNAGLQVRISCFQAGESQLGGLDLHPTPEGGWAVPAFAPGYMVRVTEQGPGYVTEAVMRHTASVT
jgi:hypothetical protein